MDLYTHLHNVPPHCPQLWKIPGFHHTYVAGYYGVVACQLSGPPTLLVSAIRAGASEVLASLERIPQENGNRRLASTCRTLECQIFTGRGIPAIAERIPVSTSTSTSTAYLHTCNLAGDVICCRGMHYTGDLRQISRGTCRGTSHLNVTRLVPGNGVECSDSRFCELKKREAGSVRRNWLDGYLRAINFPSYPPNNPGIKCSLHVLARKQGCIPRQGHYQHQHTHTFTRSSASSSSSSSSSKQRHDTISLDDQRQQIFGPDLIQQISPSPGVVLLQPSLEYPARRSVKTRNGKRQHGNLENKRCFPHRVSHDKRNLILQELGLVEINCY
ncbi:hypothetical protein NEUTE2DRAFT_134878 [Neurospora tetrasperma FGSC 2509]|nr:hypothetical protein NEUTE2DRAFT_134878 [Neurospora tetrasperma FGSC 2509]